MKKIFIVAVAMLLTFTAFAQDGRSIYNKYSDAKGVSAVYVSPAMSPETLATITNKDLIAIDQDPLGIQGLRLKKDGDLQYWFKPLENGDWAFCLLNGGPDALNVVLKWSDLDFVDDLSQRAIDFAGTNYTVKDLWNPEAKPVNTLSKGKGKNRGKMVSNTFNVTVASHDVAVYRLSPVPSKKK